MDTCTKSAEHGFYTEPAYRLLREDSEHPLILVCEHASHYIPPALHDLGLDPVAAREHIAWDPGALELAADDDRAGRKRRAEEVREIGRRLLRKLLQGAARHMTPQAVVAENLLLHQLDFLRRTL